MLIIALVRTTGDELMIEALRDGSIAGWRTWEEAQATQSPHNTVTYADTFNAETFVDFESEEDALAYIKGKLITPESKLVHVRDIFASFTGITINQTEAHELAKRGVRLKN